MAVMLRFEHRRPGGTSLIQRAGSMVDETTGVDRAAYERNVSTAYLPIGDAEEDEYDQHAQIAELNSLKATFAVMSSTSSYSRLDEASWYTFETATFELDAESRKR